MSPRRRPRRRVYDRQVVAGGQAGRGRRWSNTGGSLQTLAVKCHQTARNGAFCRCSVRDTRPAQEAVMPETTTDPQPELLTIAEAAALLRAPVATLRYWRHLGVGPRSFRLGRRVLYRRHDLHDWIDARREQDSRTGT